MRTTKISVVLACDAPGCVHATVAQSFTATWENPAVPVPTLPEGWRERRTRHGLQHACSAACERALIAPDETSTP